MTPRLGGAAALLLAIFALLFAAPLAFAAAPSFPALSGRVVDDAHVLSPEVAAGLTAKLAALEAKTGRQLVVVTLPSLQGQAIEDYGYQLGRAWGIGQKGKDDGALFIVAPAEKKVRIEVGYGLEPILTDAVSSVILQTHVLPHFRAGDIPGGVVEGTDAIVQQLGLSAADAQAQAQQAADQAQQPVRPRHHEVIGSIFSLLLFVFVISAFFRGGRRGGGLGWALPLMFLGGGFGGRDRDDDWGGGGGGDGGGGFGGGGGSFGGGGSSGGW